MTSTSDTAMPNTPRAALNHPASASSHNISETVAVDFSDPAQLRAALDRADPNWTDPCELVKFGDVTNPKWWHPCEPGDPDRLLFPTLEEICDKAKRDRERERLGPKQAAAVRREGSGHRLEAGQPSWSESQAAQAAGTTRKTSGEKLGT